MTTINKVVLPLAAITVEGTSRANSSQKLNFEELLSKESGKQNGRQSIEDKTIQPQANQASRPFGLSGSPVYIPMKMSLEENYHERALGLREYRQQLLASNIANADTPGYKARDFDLTEALRSGKNKDTVELKYSTDGLENVDGNTVNLDAERAKFMENAIMYEYEVDRIKGEYKDMQELLKNLSY